MSHRRRALDVRDVVALDAPGPVGQVQLLSQLLQGGPRLPRVGQPLDALHLQRFAGVVDGHLHQATLLAPLRHQQLHGPSSPLGEPVPDELLLGHDQR
jgi:hypothetical protein